MPTFIFDIIFGAFGILVYFLSHIFIFYLFIFAVAVLHKKVLEGLNVYII